MTRPWLAGSAALESKVAQEGRQTARAAAVRNSSGQSAAWPFGRMTAIMNTPVNDADQIVSVLVLNRPERKPVSQRLASTIGTPTQATYSDMAETSRRNSSTRYMG